MKATRALKSLAVSCSVAGALVACGTVYADPITHPYSVVSTFDSGPITLPPVEPYRCPLRVNENSPCERAGAVCELGTSSDPLCNSTFECQRDPKYGRYWAEVDPPSCTAQCPDPSQIVDGAPCTIDEASDAGTSSTESELQCVSGNTLCGCTTGPDGAHLHERRWVCMPAGDGCPVTRPLIGTGCLGDRTCDYGTCTLKRGTGMICDQGVWQVEAKPCP